jgi:hypothetical protein
MMAATFRFVGAAEGIRHMGIKRVEALSGGRGTRLLGIICRLAATFRVVVGAAEGTASMGISSPMALGGSLGNVWMGIMGEAAETVGFKQDMSATGLF